MRVSILASGTVVLVSGAVSRSGSSQRSYIEIECCIAVFVAAVTILNKMEKGCTGVDFER
jgi:hypothetical protein